MTIRPRTIVHVTDRFAPAIGGTETHVRALAAAQVRRGHHVVVVTFAGPGLAEHETIDNGVDVERRRGWSRHLARFASDPAVLYHPTVPDPALVRELRQVLAGRRADVVHAHNWIGLSAGPAARALGIPFVWSLHDYAGTCAVRTYERPDGATCTGPALRDCIRCASAKYGRLHGTVATVGLRSSRPHLARADVVVANSDAVAATLRDSVPPQRLRVISPFVHPGSIDVVPPSFLPDGEFIVFVGALGEHKGLQVLLDAYRRLRDIRTRTGCSTPALLLVGPRHDAMPAVEAAKTAVDDEQCIVVRHDVDHDDVMRTMARATALVVPSLWPEPFGLVAAEALTVGTPVIASAIGGLRALLSDGEYGLLVTPGDVEQLVAALDRILDDPQLRHELGTKGRERAQELDATAAFEQCYDELLTGTGGGHSAPPTG